MKVNGIDRVNYSDINNNKKYASRPVFKQNQSSGVIQKAIVDQFIESADDQRYSKSPLVSKLAYLKDVLFSSETSRRARELQEVLDSYDSNHNILYTI